MKHKNMLLEQTKMCSSCRNIYPLTAEFFRKDTTMKDGYRNQCKLCISAYNKLYHAANRVKRKKIYEDNKNFFVARSKRYNAANKERIAVQRKQKNAENKETIAAQTNKSNLPEAHKKRQIIQPVHVMIDSIPPVREKIDVEILDQRGNLIKTRGFYPLEWLCARPECIRITRAAFRIVSRKNKSKNHYCSPICRAIHLEHLRKKKTTEIQLIEIEVSRKK